MTTRHFSFGHGQTDPDTGENLLDKYVTVHGPSIEACREAMFASRYGEEWAFEYAPDSPTWQQWGPRWTEHERIDVAAAERADLCGSCDAGLPMTCTCPDLPAQPT